MRTKLPNKLSIESCHQITEAHDYHYYHNFKLLLTSKFLERYSKVRQKWH